MKIEKLIDVLRVYNITNITKPEHEIQMGLGMPFPFPYQNFDVLGTSRGICKG